MATRTRSGLFLPVVVVIVLVAVFGIDKLIDTATDAIGTLTGGTAVLGMGDTKVMIADSARDEARRCTIDHMLHDKRCGDLTVLVVNAAWMPFIARNTKLAWETGRPGVLTMNRAMQAANRNAACGKFELRFKRIGSCDEYPMAVTEEGGGRARTEEVPARENSCQGGSYRNQYPVNGERFLVVIKHPELIATEPFAGFEIARDKGRC